MLANSFWCLGFGAMVVAPISLQHWSSWAVWAFGQTSPLNWDKALGWANKIWLREVRKRGTRHVGFPKDIKDL